jgi:hypothetical protein
MEASKLIAEMKDAIRAMDKQRDLIQRNVVALTKTVGVQSETTLELLAELRGTIDGYDEAVTAMETAAQALDLEYPAE